MKRTILLLGGLYALLSVTIAQTASVKTCRLSLEVTNTWNQDKNDEPVVVNLQEATPGFRVCSAIVMEGEKEIPSQLDDLNGDLHADELAFVIDLKAGERKKLNVTLSSAKSEKSYSARVYAELLIRDSKSQKHAPVQSVTVSGQTNIYNHIYGHGPMLESELVGYRIYFNQKQTIDPYGKFQKRLELKESRFYPNDTQLAQGFGDDVLMVGNSCGIGALKGWNGTKATHIEPIVCRTERILSYGPIRAIAEVEVKGWSYQGNELNMTHRYILYAGHRDLRIETTFSQPLGEEVFCTGVQDIMGGETLSYSDHQGLVGSWGRHWPVTDTVKYAKETIGIATCIPRKHIRKEVKDKDNFLYTLAAPGEKGFCYHTMFTSRKETFGYPTAEAWFSYLPLWKEGLEHPATVKIIK